MPDNLADNDTGDLPCQDKARYGTQKEARAAATVAKHQHGAKLTTYRCRFCDLWHLATDYN